MSHQQGYLIIVDIAGYTAFLTQTELEHAQAIIDDLLNMLLEQTQPPLVFVKVEGDAVFTYAPQGSFAQGQTLVEAVEKLYCHFATALESMYRNTNCTCQACQLIPTLDLKFVVHYGSFSLTEIGGQQELTGPEVMLARHLYQSQIAEKSGFKGFVFFTAAAIEALALENMAQKMLAHTESHQEFGKINGFVHDLRPVWAKVRAQQHIAVEPEAAWLVVELDLPLPPPLAWDYVTDPQYRRHWLEADSITVAGLQWGRTGIDTQHICAHGKRLIKQVIADWRPFEYLTIDATTPLNGVLRQTTHLTPVECGTRISWYVDRVRGRNPLHTLLLRLLLGRMKGFLTHRLQRGGAVVQKIIESDLAAGKIVMEGDGRLAIGG